MSIIRIEDIAYVCFAAPDLDEMRDFLIDFGMLPLPIHDGMLYARGTGPAPVLHITSLGPADFTGFAFRAASLADLDRLADFEGAEVDDLAMPGGGRIVRLTDPDGFAVDVIAGQSPISVVELPRQQPRNSAHARPRVSEPLRVAAGPSNVVRLGHLVLKVKDFRASEAWYKSRFGLITSDEVERKPGVALGAFLRCDRGPIPTDHHTLFLLQGDSAGFGHAAYEVADFDDLMRGHVRLRQAKRTHAWGIGRHLLGSAIADYWRDPWGHGIEHWTDGDLFVAVDGSRTATIEELETAQWGPPSGG